MRIDHATRADRPERRATGKSRFFPILRAPRGSLQLELADEWYLRERTKMDRQKDRERGWSMILRDGIIYTRGKDVWERERADCRNWARNFRGAEICDARKRRVR